MAWDHRYKRLNEGEVILESDECFTDSHIGWRRDDGRCAGKLAPNPNFTSHRAYRRKRKCGLCGIIRHRILVIHAKIVFSRAKRKFAKAKH